MWLFRGAQSAVFYYISCTPCGEHSYRKRRKKEAAKSLQKRNRDRDRDQPNTDTTVTDQPRPVFHQPSPFSTNPYWREEIELGPGPPLRRAQRNGGGGGGSCPGSQRDLHTPHSPVSSTTKASNAGCESRTNSSRSALADRWNRVRYQREDEKLWAAELKGSSAGLSGRGRTDTAGSCKKYYSMGRNPEVNDLHPPIACGPRTREETRWMVQPPPSAKVMEGRASSDEWAERRSRETSPRPQRRARPAAVVCGSGPPEEENGRPTPCHFKKSGPCLTPTKKSSSPQPPPIIIAGDTLSAIAEPPDGSCDTDILKRPPLVMIASKQDLPQHAEYLNPSSPLNSRLRSNSPGPLPKNPSSQPDLSSRLHTVRSNSRSKPAADAKNRAVTSPGGRAPDADVKQVRHERHLEHESSDSNAMVDSGGGRLQVPQHSRPFRWSLDI